jgi:hypothetical protein
MDPFSGNPHVTWAIYCVGFALVAALLLLADVISDRQHELEGGRACKK